MKTPCENCPRRKSSSTETIPGFNPRLMQNLKHNCSGDGWAMMACHKSHEGKDSICAGFAIAVGFGSIGLRLAHMLGEFKPAEYSCEKTLHESFDAMMLANGIEPQ